MSFDQPGPGGPPPHDPGPGAAPVGVQAAPHAPSPGQPVLPGRPVWTAPPQPGPPQSFDVPLSPRGLATALTALLSFRAVVDLASAAGGAYSYSVQQDLIADPSSAPDDAIASVDVLNALVDGVQLLCLIAIAVVFIIWFHRVRCNGEIFRPDAFTESRGWAVAGWFIPLANLVLPYRTAKQIWWGSTQLGPDGAHRSISTAPVTTWWLVFVASEVLTRIDTWQYMRAESHEELANAFAFGTFADLVSIAAVVFAVIFVRKLTAMQNTMAAQGPYAAA
ncbi:DUF4328 domain-containing protein [Streptomyces xanthophaeus]|uniref:DUF4328 domain-containing protein n=1 Tax=Streptomyces xanthophaeus TaxID=67385 RepID=UPI00343D2548